MGCGSNQYGQLGPDDVGMDIGYGAQGPIAMVAGEAVKTVMAGAYHTVILSTS